jgi:hypothetical protein
MKSLLAKKIQFKKKNLKLNDYDSIKNFQGLIEFIKDLIARKIDF